MSRPVPRAKSAAPTRSAGVQPQGSRTSTKPGTAGSKTVPAAHETHNPGIPMDKPRPFELPALSIIMKPKKSDDAEKSKRKTIRRNAPPAEDEKKLREILKSIAKQEINVHEFIGLIAPSTGDNADCMREVMADEMASFRKLAKKVYDTMTQDISDVLTNEHVQLQDLVKERSERYRDKMTRSMDEIFAILPDFDFDRYYNENGYLDKMFPVVEAEVVDPDEEEAQIRQEAFHRFQWLRSEGDRLGEENSRLQKRLNELKRKQKQELMRAQEIEQEAEQRRLQLQNAEYDLEEQIEELNKSIEQSMVEQEQFITEKTQPKPRPRKLPAKKKLPSRTSESKPEWNVGAAQDLEEKTAEVTAHAETSRIAMTTATSGVSQKDGRSKLSQTIAAAKKKSRSQVQQPQGQQEKDPFHFSPIKTPPREPPRQKEISPFHFSPPKSPRQVALPAADASEPQATTSRQPQARRYDPSRTDYQIGRAQMQSANFW